MTLKAGSVFFITGGARGIGGATASQAIQAGHKVVIADMNYAGALAHAESLGDNARAIELDVRDPAQWAGALDYAQQQFGTIDVLVNNAGMMVPGYFIDQSPQDLKTELDVNVYGAALGLQIGTKLMIEQGHGHIITLGSMASFVSLRGQSFYSATKHAVRSLVYGFEQEIKDTPVTLSLVHPGAVETAMLETQIGHEANSLSFAQSTLTPEKVATKIIALANKPKREAVIPASQNFVVRILGVFPTLLNMALSSQWKGANKARQKRAQ